MSGFLKRAAPLLALGLLVIVLILSGAGRYLSFEALSENEARLRQAVADQPALAFGAFILLYAAITAASIPGASLLTLAGGLLFGTWAGGAATAIGATIGAVGVFLAVRTSLGAALRQKAEAAGGRLKSLMDGLEQGAFGYILTLRLIPLFPFWLVNVACALAHAPLRAYTLATFLGILPATFIYSGIGAGLGAVLREGGRPDAGVILKPEVFGPLLALGLLSLGATLYQRWSSKKTPQP
jgi:uncharacterized membrane protein YdjX (TVP38/TMEM64 family)